MQLGSLVFRGAGIVFALCTVSAAIAQPPDFGGRGFGGGGFGGRGGPGGPWRRIKLLPPFGKDGKGYLNSAERKATREHLATQPPPRHGGLCPAPGSPPPPTT